MDKETLSNYGWIVICVLVLAVMIALAGPFGNFIADAVKSTAQGLFDVNKNALDTAGIVIDDNGFTDGENGESQGSAVPCGIEGHTIDDDKGEHGIPATDCYSGHTYTCECSAGWTAPNGGTYTMYTAVNGKSVYTAGEQLPCGYVTKHYDKYECGDYKYIYQTSSKGWSVAINTDVTDKNQTTYGPIESEINGIPVTNMDSTFTNCTSLVTAPVIPNSVTTMTSTFRGCTSLTTAPTIPSSVTTMTSTFTNCTSLTTAPKIPSKVTNMGKTFQGCTSIITAPTIPKSVTDMSQTFYGCTSLTGTITIHANPTTWTACLYNTKITTIAGSTTMAASILKTTTTAVKNPTA